MGGGRQRLPKPGRKSVGVARQYCGRLGKVANCQGGMCLAYVSPLGRALVDKRLYLPESWTSDKDRCETAGVPEQRQGYRSKTQLALEMLGQALGRGHLQGAGLPGMAPSGCRRPSARDWRPWGCATSWTFRRALRCWPEELEWTRPAYQGRGAPRKLRLLVGQRRTMMERGAELSETAWRELTVAEGSEGPRRYRFSAQRVRPTSRRKPG